LCRGHFLLSSAGLALIGNLLGCFSLREGSSHSNIKIVLRKEERRVARVLSLDCEPLRLEDWHSCEGAPGYACLLVQLHSNTMKTLRPECVPTKCSASPVLTVRYSLAVRRMLPQPCSDPPLRGAAVSTMNPLSSPLGLAPGRRALLRRCSQPLLLLYGAEQW